MAKRFTDTDKYRKPFMRGLKAPYKLLWDYLYHDCNHAGIWIVDIEIARIYLGLTEKEINEQDALRHFNAGEERVVVLGNKWFIKTFIEFQYNGELKRGNRTHESVIRIMEENGIDYHNFIKPLVSPSEGVIDKDKDKNKDKDKDKDLLSVRKVEEYPEPPVEKPLTKKKEIREKEFTNDVFSIGLDEGYGNPMLEKFVRYWTESKPKGLKMKFEMQNTFDIKRRLLTWSENDYGKNQGDSRQKNDKYLN